MSYFKCDRRFRRFFELLAAFLIAAIPVLVCPVAHAQTPDDYEPDDLYYQGSFINVNDTSAQRHNFHAAGDQDWGMFRATAGKIYRIEVENVGRCDPMIELFDMDGETPLLPPEDNALDEVGEKETLDWDTCTLSGVYFVKISFCTSCNYGNDAQYDLKIFEPYAPIEKGSFTGSVKDLNGNPVIGAQIATYKNTDEEVMSVTSLKPDGLFAMDLHELGSFTMEITRIGCTTDSRSVSLTYNDELVDLGEISLGCVAPGLCDLLGDVNGDGRVLIDDVKLAYSFLIVDPTPEQFCKANTFYNGDNDPVEIFFNDITGVFDLFIGKEP